MTRLQLRPKCDGCSTRADVVGYDDDPTRWAICASCRRRALLDDENMTLGAWAPEATWAARSTAQRIHRALHRARMSHLGESREVARTAVGALFAEWLRRPDVGPYYTWSIADCAAIQLHGAPVVERFAKALVTGDARVVLLAGLAQRSRFPRLSLLSALTVDRVRAIGQRITARRRVRGAVNDAVNHE